MSTFSIIIPSYNSAATIAECIQSVLKQLYTNFEVWVIDGASTDNTVQIVESFNAGGKVKIISEKDGGIYDAMNKGVKNANGEWLYFLGSDDQMYDESTLSAIAATIQSNPDSKFVYGDVITSNNTIERYTDYKYDQLMDRCICHQSIFYHKSLFADKQYDTQYKVCADWDFNLKTFSEDVHPVYVDKLIAKFDLGGVSGNWMEHPEYLKFFSDKNNMAFRYRGTLYLFGYFSLVMYRKITKRLSWMFQS